MPVYRVPITLTWNGSGSPGVNVWSVRTTASSPVGDAELQSALDALHAFYVGIGNAFAGGTAIELGEMSVRDTSQRATGTFTKITSSNAAAKAAPSLQVVIGWRTDLAKRRGMGRTYIGPLGADYVGSDGTIEDSKKTGMGTNAQTLLDASLSTTNGWGLGVWGLADSVPMNPPDPGSQPHQHRDFIGYKIRDQFGILRSRRD